MLCRLVTVQWRGTHELVGWLSCGWLEGCWCMVVSQERRESETFWEILTSWCARSKVSNKVSANWFSEGELLPTGLWGCGSHPSLGRLCTFGLLFVVEAIRRCGDRDGCWGGVPWWRHICQHVRRGDTPCSGVPTGECIPGARQIFRTAGHAGG